MQEGKFQQGTTKKEFPAKGGQTAEQRCSALGVTPAPTRQDLEQTNKTSKLIQGRV